MKHFISVLILLFFLSSVCEAKKKVYMSYILHGNMNYDRYVRPVIWEEFPVIYNNLLDFMDVHPDFKGQLQFSGQTFKSLQQAAPSVLNHAMDIHRRGQLNFTGTFYSEPVNVNMDGETNFRCAWLGTRIIEDAIGETDGFYLQERAYHPQLPWILNHANVSWVPVITETDTYFPFKLRGMDGSLSVCVPITRDKIIDKIKSSPKNSLIVIEEDYEIPQSFTHTYATVADFNKDNKDIEVEWITVKEYLKRFGTQNERYVDHSLKARSMENGTYSRWTADPLDIIVQEATNKAMNDFRSAEMMSALLKYLYGKQFDIPLAQSDVNLKYDPLVWDIERAELYPDIEPSYLKRNGEITMLTRAENLLLWAVNSDAKGWFPLYEKRRERINSFENSSMLSRKVIDDGMDWLASQIKLNGYDTYFMVTNMEYLRPQTVTLLTELPYEVYDYSTGMQLPSETIFKDGRYSIDVNMSLPQFGYKVLGLKKIPAGDKLNWTSGQSIQNKKIKLAVLDDGNVSIQSDGQELKLSLDSFMIRSLAEISGGVGDDVWREAKPYGDIRVSIREGLYPQLRLDRQIDWLVHMQQLYTLKDGDVQCDIQFVFPHPTLIRREAKSEERNFDPRGLNLLISSGKPGWTGYDIPFGISRDTLNGVSYFCPLTSCFYQYRDGSGFMVSPQSGEQAFNVNADAGTVTLYMGASTTSGPIRKEGLKFVTPTEVDHESAWYLEPFHGTYHHRVILHTYNGDWKDAQIPSKIRSITQPVYVRQCQDNTSGKMAPEYSFLKSSSQHGDIVTLQDKNKGLLLRMNERIGSSEKVEIEVDGHKEFINLTPFGIIDAEIKSK